MGRAGNTKNTGRHYERETRVARVDARLTKAHLEHYWELLELMETYEDDCIANPSPRNDKFMKFMEEAAILLSDA